MIAAQRTVLQPVFISNFKHPLSAARANAQYHFRSSFVSVLVPNALSARTVYIDGAAEWHTRNGTNHLCHLLYPVAADYFI